MDPIRIALQDPSSSLWIKKRDEGWTVTLQRSSTFHRPIPLDVRPLFRLVSKDPMSVEFASASSRLELLWDYNRLIATFRDQVSLVEQIVDVQSFDEAVTAIHRTELLDGLMLLLEDAVALVDVPLEEFLSPAFAVRSNLEAQAIAEVLAPLDPSSGLWAFQALAPMPSDVWRNMPLAQILQVIDP